MRMHSKMFAAIFAAGVGVAALPTSSQAGVIVDIGVAPPPPPAAVVVPPPRAGFVWSPGYYRWDGHRHVWMDGVWMRERPGYHWVGPHWEGGGNHWHYHEGYWAR